MAVDVASLRVLFSADTGDFDNGVKRVRGGLAGVADQAMGLGSAVTSFLATGAVAAVAAVATIGAASIKSASDSEAVTSQLNAVLKSTGGIAGVTADQAKALASSLEKVTRSSDETILGGENLLLTFTKIGKDIFPQATEIMLDMSQALGQDVKSSAIQLGKALQDPIEGVTALKRVGVNFTESQMTMIKAMVNAGRTADAQRLIMKELATEFGNSARAAGQTFAGKLDQLKNALDNILESVGGALLPGLTAIATVFADVARTVGGAIEATIGHFADMAKAGASFGLMFRTAAANIITDILTGLGMSPDQVAKIAAAAGAFFAKVGTTIGDGIKALRETFGGGGAAIPTKTTAISDFVGVSDADKIAAVAASNASYKDLVDKIMAGGTATLEELKNHPLLSKLQENMQKAVPSEAKYGLAPEVSKGGGENPLLAFLKTQLGITPDVEKQITDSINGIIKVVTPVLDSLKNGITGFFDAFKNTDWSGLQKVIQGFIDFQTKLDAGALALIGVVLYAVGQALPSVGKVLSDLANALSQLMAGDPGKAFDTVKNAIVNFFGSLGGIGTGVIDKILGVLNIDPAAIGKQFSDLGTTISTSVGDIFKQGGPVDTAFAPFKTILDDIFGDKGIIALFGADMARIFFPVTDGISKIFGAGGPVDTSLQVGKGLFDAVFGPTGSISIVLGGFKSVLDTVTTFLDGIFGEKGTAKPFLDAFSADVSKIFGKDGPIQGAFEEIKTAVSGVITAFTNEFSNVVKIILTPFADVIEKIGQLLSDIGGLGGMFSGLADTGSSLKKFAQSLQARDTGGPLNMGQGYKSNIPEVFFPPGTMAVPLANMQGGGGGQTISIGQVILQGVQDVDKLLDELDRRADRRNNRLQQRM